MKQIDIFDRLNNTIGNHMEGKATDQDLIGMAYEVDKYLLQHPHPHDLIKNNVGLSDVVGQSESFICDHCESECTDMSKEVVLHSKCYDKLLENK
jgi:hypothetical protein